MDMVIWFNVIMGAGLFVGMAIWVWRSKLRSYNVAEFYTPMMDSIQLSDYVYRFLGKVEVKDGAEFAKFKGKSYTLNWSKPSIYSTRKTIFCFDVLNNKQVQFSGGGCWAGDVDLHDMVLSNSLMRRFLNSVSGVDKMVLLLLIMMVGVAVLAFVLGYFIYPQMNPLPFINNTVPSPPSNVVT